MRLDNNTVQAVRFYYVPQVDDVIYCVGDVTLDSIPLLEEYTKNETIQAMSNGWFKTFKRFCQVISFQLLTY